MTKATMTALAPKSEPSDIFEGTSFRMLGIVDNDGVERVYDSYRIVERSGEHPTFRTIAKVYPKSWAADSEQLNRLADTLRALNGLSTRLVDVSCGYGFLKDGRPFFIMVDYLPSEPRLSQILASGIQFSVAQVLVFSSYLLAALKKAHASGIVHHDIRPENLMVLDYGDAITPGVSVTDFGVAPLVAIQVHNQLLNRDPATTRHYYMSPEQASGEPVDHRTDIYNAGLVLYRLLAGRGPFDDRKTISSVIKAHLYEKPLPPSHYADRVPRRFDEAVLKALRKQPSDRYQSAEEFTKALEGVMFDAFALNEVQACVLKPTPTASVSAGQFVLSPPAVRVTWKTASRKEKTLLVAEAAASLILILVFVWKVLRGLRVP